MRRPKFRFVRYSKVKLAGERVRYKVSVITRSVIARSVDLGLHTYESPLATDLNLFLTVHK